MTAQATDAEIICEFMEPRPTINRDQIEIFRAMESSKWWYWGWKSQPGNLEPVVYGWRYRPLTLDRLHEVEERLSQQQVLEYNRLLWDNRTTYVWHTPADQKIRALASVLRDKPGNGEAESHQGSIAGRGR